jgi:divalent metal cation (Fe/Co/Zn/Cd) transporter
MRSIVKQFSEGKGITFLQARNSGRFMFVYINLSLSLKRLRAAHEITNNIEEEIKSRILCVERVIIHYEPERKEYQRSAVPLANRKGEISEHFGSDPFITLWDKETLMLKFSE